MKLIFSLCLSMVMGLCAAQNNELSESFLKSYHSDYHKAELTKRTQFFRMILPLKKRAAFQKAVELKSKNTHNSAKTKFRDRNQVIGFYAFEYASKQDCSLSVDSLLMCLPNTCSKVERGKSASGEFTPSVYIIDAQTVYCIETFCEDTNEAWDEMVKDFVDTFATKKSLILYATCSALEWKSKSSFAAK